MASKRKVDISEFDLLQTLGTGSFGRVRLAKSKKNGRYYALKILKKFDIVKLKQVDHVLHENSILAEIEHPFLVNLCGFDQDSRYLYFALEYIPGGELFTYLRTQGRLEVDHAKFYGAQVVSMFQYLHSKDIIYRDLKPENILIQKNGYLKLTDFGFAKVVSSAGKTYTLCGTPQYLAPEVLLNKGHGKPVDWWCLGILIYEMIAGIDPFNDDDTMGIYQKILKGKIKFPKEFDRYGSPKIRDAKSLVKHLLVADVTKRYGCLKAGVADIKTHRWFNKLDWAKLLTMKTAAPYTPTVLEAGDTSNFSTYPDSQEESPPVSKDEDPFLDW